MTDVLDVVKAELSNRRFDHVLGVVKTARELAARYSVDGEKAALAAALHDVYREKTATELRTLANEVDFAVPDDDFATWHGPVTAARLARDFQVLDDEVAEAIAWHTVGHPEMGRLAQVLYVADTIEPGRVFDGVDDLRVAAALDLSLAVAVAADASIFYLLEKQSVIAMNTVLLRNQMWRMVDEPMRKDYNQRRT